MFGRSASQAVPKMQIKHRKQSRNILDEYWTQQGLAIDEQSARKDRLDLIFRNQPKQIQEKLTKLLIKYNATMQYNKRSDMFEVDLLIPFTNQEQKKQFMRQFLQIRKQKKIMAQNDEQKGDKLHVQDIQWIGQFNQRRKFSFNTAGKDNQNPLQEKKQKQQVWINQIPDVQAVTHKKDQNQFNYDADPFEYDHSRKNTGQFPELTPAPPEPQLEPLDLNKLEEVIKRRLKNAVFFIKNKDNQFDDNFLNAQYKRQKEKQIIQKVQPPIRQQSIIDQLYIQQSAQQSGNSTQKFKEQKFMNNSSYIRQDTQHLFSNRTESYPYSSQIYSNVSKQQSNPFIKIAQEPQEDDYEPNYKQRQMNPQSKDGKVISFDDFSKKYEAVKYEQFSKGRPKIKSTTSSIRSSQGSNQQLKSRFDGKIRKDR